MRVLKAAVLIGFGIAVGAIGSMSASSPTQVPSTPLCSLPDKGTYSPGAIVRHDGQGYRCFYVHGSDMKPSSVGWIKMQQVWTVDESQAGR